MVLCEYNCGKLINGVCAKARYHHTKGKNNPNYGKHWSNEMKQHLSSFRKNKKLPVEWANKLKGINKGRNLNLTLEEKQRRAERLKLNNPVKQFGPWNKGKQWSNEVKQKMKDAWTDERRQQQSKRMKAIPKELTSMYGKKRPEWFSKMQTTMKKNGKAPGCRSQQEYIVCDYLDISEIKYQTNQYIGNHNVDILIENQKVIIEINGCYWHGCSKHFPNEKQRFDDTNIKTKNLQCMGYKVINIWEHDVEQYNFDEMVDVLGTPRPFFEGDVIYMLRGFDG